MKAGKIRAKLSVLVPFQIACLRRNRNLKQCQLAKRAGMHQSRVSTIEIPGYNPTIETLSKIAAALGVGLKIEFVSLAEMKKWDDSFDPNTFEVKP